MPSSPFSILGRIVVVETKRTGSTPKSLKTLSVSSDGSWWLKQDGQKGLCREHLSFSILGRIVVVETTRSTRPDRQPCSPFSILGRIVVVETRCRLLLSRAITSRVALSVSSDGSWWLKLEARNVNLATTDSFSILGRIVVVETAPAIWHWLYQ